jgi:hypothetical protein
MWLEFLFLDYRRASDPLLRTEVRLQCEIIVSAILLLPCKLFGTDFLGPNPKDIGYLFWPFILF